MPSSTAHSDVSIADAAGLAGVPPPARPIAVIDAVRVREIYGDVFRRLGVEAVSVAGKSPEQIVALNPAALLISREWDFDWRLASAAARRANIPVVYVVDGVLEWSYVWNNLNSIRPHGTMLQPLIASDLCVIGQHQARILSSMGLADRIHVVGMPRFDNLSRDRVVRHGAKPRIIVATARTAGHSVEQQAMTHRALRDLHSWFAGHPEVEVVWHIAGDLAEDIGVRADITGSMSDALSQATGLISFTSTCLLEAMHKGIPAVQIDYRSSPVYVATAWEIRCAAHIPGVMQEILYPAPEKLAWQDACFADELESGDATEKLASVIRNAIASPEPYAKGSAGQPTRVHGRLDYHQIHSELSAFAMSDSAVLQYELSAAYTALRHAKHEKGHLQRECVELSEACIGQDLRDVRAYRFVERLSEAQASVPGSPGSVSAKPCTIHGRTSPTLLLHPPAKVTFAVPTGAAGKISFAIGMHPDVWTNPLSGPCRFLIRADENTVFDATVDMVADPADRKWWWFDVPVPAVEGPAHTIVFETEGVGANDFRWAVWRNPIFLWVESEGKEAFRPRAISGYDFYCPGLTVPVSG